MEPHVFEVGPGGPLCSKMTDPVLIKFCGRLAEDPVHVNTPAEIITGISDRCAAALEDVNQIRHHLDETHASPVMYMHLERIILALKERAR